MPPGPCFSCSTRIPTRKSGVSLLCDDGPYLCVSPLSKVTTALPSPLKWSTVPFPRDGCSTRWYCRIAPSPPRASASCSAAYTTDFFTIFFDEK